MTDLHRSLLLHLGLIVLLFLLQFLLPEYHTGNLARVMVTACFAMGYNLLYGYAGLLSLGHAMLFAAGMYGFALPVYHLNAGVAGGLLAGTVCGIILSAVIALLALRTRGVSFMIVTLMFSQAFYLAVLYFGDFTRGDEGFVIQATARTLMGVDLTASSGRYFASLSLFAVCLFLTMFIVHSRFGKTLIAIRENEERTMMLGYNVFLFRFLAFVASGAISALSGACYGLLFGYAGATFASVQYSILPLLWVLLGGAGTLLGPFAGTLFMFYLIDIASGLTTAYLLLIGAALVLLTLYAPRGIFGEIRRRFWPWLP